MEKLANNFLAVSLGCFILAICCQVGAAWHRPFAVAANLLIALSAIPGAGMIWALAQLSKRGEIDG